ncbi:TetR/AcrR family transcriptional regulator [Alicyclobacillus sp.]|uniref:TetR/AcrR family transcriptional regulator n=1 Tax=Alicyclobacillus sp. TaxID=61169 RepID=UPI0025C5C07F|nr:TetR/AcrR family transcriptional regulator [Alicyclobacillus sp.]MCL6515306.1 TetR/AcrR family transcriptional regulator [Alicyclobacillus sp.]
MPSRQYFNLSSEKQETIVHAGLREFAQYGYDGASTNRIVEEAGISKGVLFKYFADKENFFLYIVERALQTYTAAFPTRDVLSYDSPFAWMKDITLRKIRFSQERPLTYQLLMRIAKEPAHPVYAKAMESIAQTSEQYLAQVAAWLPNDGLRDGLTWQQVFALVNWIAQGMVDQYVTRLPEAVDDDFETAFEQIHADLDLYLDIIRRGVYKEEGP